MYNPLKRVDDVFRKGPLRDRFKRKALHPITEWYEILSFISFLPAMFIFLHAFVLSAANMVACFQIEKGQFGLARFIIIVFDFIPSIASLILFASGESTIEMFGMVVIFGGLGVLGLLSINKQRNLNQEAA